MIKNISIIAISIMIFSSCGTSKATTSTTKKEETTTNVSTKKTTQKKEPLVIKSNAGLRALSAKTAKDKQKVKNTTTLELKKVK